MGNNDPKSTTLKIMFVKNLQLIRMRESRVKPSKQEEEISGNERRIQKDSMPPSSRRLQADSVRPLRGGVQLKK